MTVPDQNHGEEADVLWLFAEVPQVTEITKTSGL